MRFDQSLYAKAATGIILKAFLRERVKAGLNNAGSKGKKLGRPKVGVDIGKAKIMQNSGYFLRQIAKMINISKSSLSRLINNNDCPKNPVELMH